MLNQQTMEKLLALRLEGMAQALEEQRRQNDVSRLDFEERLALLVERQWAWRESRALAARLHHAQLKVAACLEDIDYRHPRGLKRAQIEQLRAGQWVAQHRNCLITGSTGSGKTYLACAWLTKPAAMASAFVTTTLPNCFANCKTPRPTAAC